MRETDTDVCLTMHDSIPKRIRRSRSLVIDRDYKKRLSLSSQEEKELIRENRVAEMTYRLDNGLDLWTGLPRSE